MIPKLRRRQIQQLELLKLTAASRNARVGKMTSSSSKENNKIESKSPLVDTVRGFRERFVAFPLVGLTIDPLFVPGFSSKTQCGIMRANRAYAGFVGSSIEADILRRKIGVVGRQGRFCWLFVLWYKSLEFSRSHAPSFASSQFPPLVLPLENTEISLIEYLIAPFAFAASVMSLGGPYSPPHKTGVDFEGCARQIQRIKEPISLSCQQSSFVDVDLKLKEIYKEIEQVALQFHSTVEGEEKTVGKYSKSFVKVLVSFDAVLRVIVDYPTIEKRSSDSFKKINTKFESIVNDFQTHGLGLGAVIRGEASIDLSFWAQFGFTFQSKITID
ncbi:hypothetical protein O181_010764 [Austropuccinia psidii MF-1]|uniref:Uncharacterized protein n=1 Tax=Austropuccinia psidii MF-1 TaxID=1389203 RepID=A0A9Q3BTA4_9BASI|nr:hypothetical protein [Austropuccinia psidii MF-1]